MNNYPQPAEKTYEEIQIGEVHSFETLFSESDLKRFAELSGDYNPIHMDPEYAKSTPFKQPVVFGMLTGSLFSRLLGMYCPGKNALYLSQTLQFRKPVFMGQKLLVKGTVLHKTDSSRSVTLLTEVFADGILAITGEAMAKVLKGSSL